MLRDKVLATIRTMLMGHYSVALVAKAVAPRTPLWTLFFAVQFVDILWASFIIVGIEHAGLDPTLSSNALVLYDMPYTHSLLATAIWAVVAGCFGSMLGRERGEGWVIGLAVGLCVISHWVLDVLVHRPDMVIFNDDPRFKVGLGLWNYPLLSLALELVLIIGASLWLWRAYPPARTRTLLWFAGGLVVVQTALTFGPHPPTVMTISATALLSFLALAGAAAWLEAQFGASHPR